VKLFSDAVRLYFAKPDLDALGQLIDACYQSAVSEKFDLDSIPANVFVSEATSALADARKEVGVADSAESVIFAGGKAKHLKTPGMVTDLPFRSVNELLDSVQEHRA
jgi:hypothetical protein